MLVRPVVSIGRTGPHDQQRELLGHKPHKGMLVFNSMFQHQHEVIVNLLLLILIIVTKSCVLYLLTNIFSSLLFLVHQHEFEEYLDNDTPPRYQGPWKIIESEVEYNIWDHEHRRLMCEYLNTIQQLPEQKI
jgi:hypothetical protein